MSIKTYLVMGLMCCTPALAGTMGEIQSSASGFYIGGGIGIANLIDRESTPYAANFYDRHDFSSTGFLGGGLLGYDINFGQNLLLGLEGFINGSSLNVAAEQQYGTLPSYNASMQYNMGLRLLPAYEFSPGNSGHILLGYSYGRFTIQDDGNYGYINKKLSGNGFQGGLGVTLGYSSALSLRADMIYTLYGKNNSLGWSNSISPQNYSNHFASLEGDLALVYQFLNG